jgi:tRNA G18 (ribose-2'-O)-methylase SpoU
MRKLLNEELERLDIEGFRAASKIPIRVVMDNVRSLNNIGSVFRTADAFRLEGIVLCGITATPPHREIHKTALGATESVPWEYVERTTDAIRMMKEQGYSILSLEQAEGAVLLDRVRLDPDGRYALVLGHEIRGVDQEVVDMSDMCIEIPQFGTKHSLNISVAAGIVFWELFKQFSL